MLPLHLFAVFTAPIVRLGMHNSRSELNLWTSTPEVCSVYLDLLVSDGSELRLPVAIGVIDSSGGIEDGCCGLLLYEDDEFMVAETAKTLRSGLNVVMALADTEREWTNAGVLRAVSHVRPECRCLIVPESVPGCEMYADEVRSAVARVCEH